MYIKHRDKIVNLEGVKIIEKYNFELGLGGVRLSYTTDKIPEVCLHCDNTGEQQKLFSEIWEKLKPLKNYYVGAPILNGRSYGEHNDQG